MVKKKTVKVVCMGIQPLKGGDRWCYANIKDYKKPTSLFTCTKRGDYYKEIGAIYEVTVNADESYMSKSFEHTDTYIEDEDLIEKWKYETEDLQLKSEIKKAKGKISNMSEIKKLVMPLAVIYSELGYIESNEFKNFVSSMIFKEGSKLKSKNAAKLRKAAKNQGE